MTKKFNGKYRARFNARGYEQIDGLQYASISISSPVINDAKVVIMLVLSLIFGWSAELIDFQGAFLCDNFKHEKKYSWVCQRDLKNIIHWVSC
jgi:hypothetical protein